MRFDAKQHLSSQLSDPVEVLFSHFDLALLRRASTYGMTVYLINYEKVALYRPLKETKNATNHRCYKNKFV